MKEFTMNNASLSEERLTQKYKDPDEVYDTLINSTKWQTI